MKKYIFITNSIRNMGGAQMYMRNKILFLQKHGWSTSVYFFTEGNVLIPELQAYECNRIPELAYPVMAIGKKKREEIIDKMAKDLCDSEECIFESNVYPICLWAEAVAKKINGRNLLFIIQEGFPAYNKQEEKYLRFKLDRGEFLNRSYSIEIRIGKKWDNPKYFQMPSYSNVTTPEEYSFEYENGVKNILSIGRLDKPYIMPMLKEIVAFTEKTGEEVNLFFVGGAAEESYINIIKDYLKGHLQIKAHFFGYMFPVPENLIKASNVAIASSGSVLVPTELGVPTIAVDAHDFMAMGIYGETTQNTFVRTTEPKLHIADLLYDVLVDGKYKDIEVKPSESTLEAEIILQEHLAIIDSLDAPKEYFDIDTLYSRKEIMKQKAIMLVYRLFGEHGAEKIAKFKNKIIG